MTVITIRAELFQAFEKLAHESGTTAEALITECIERNVALVRERWIQEEADRYRAQHSALFPLYAGQYIAMLNGELLDHDAEIGPLYDRIRERYGDDPVLITPVTAEPIRVFNMRSPRLERPAEGDTSPPPAHS